MKLTDFKTARKNFRGTSDKNLTSKVFKIIKDFEVLGNAPSTRQINNVLLKVQTVTDAIKKTDKATLGTASQDSLLQSVLNPLKVLNKLNAVYGEGNQKFWTIKQKPK